MNKKNLLSGRDRELAELAEQYENAKAENRNVYMDADDLADLADWYEVRQQPDMAMEVVEELPLVETILVPALHC